MACHFEFLRYACSVLSYVKVKHRYRVIHSGNRLFFRLVSSLFVVVVLVRVGFGWVWVRFGGNRKFMLSLSLMLPTYVWSRHCRFDGNSMCTSTLLSGFANSINNIRRIKMRIQSIFFVLLGLCERRTKPPHNNVDKWTHRRRFRRTDSIQSN